VTSTAGNIQKIVIPQRTPQSSQSVQSANPNITQTSNPPNSTQNSSHQNSAPFSDFKYSAQAEIDRLKALYEHKIQVAESKIKENQQLVANVDALEALVKTGKRECQKLIQELELTKSLLDATKSNLEEADLTINQNQVEIRNLNERNNESALQIKNLIGKQREQESDYQQLQRKLESVEKELYKNSSIQALNVPKISVQQSLSNASYNREPPRNNVMHSPQSPETIKPYESIKIVQRKESLQTISDQFDFSVFGPTPTSFVSSTFGFKSNNATIKACESSGMAISHSLNSPEKILENLKSFLKNCEILTRECTLFEKSFESTDDERESMMDMQDLLASSLSTLMELCKSVNKGSKDPRLFGSVQDQVDRCLFTISCMGQMLGNENSEDLGKNALGLERVGQQVNN
jgi:hypothetical protein